LFHSLQHEPHEVTLSAYAAERFDSSISREDLIEHKREIIESSGITRICKRYGFSEVYRSENLCAGERNVCPYDGLPAHIFTFTAHSVSIVQASKFSGALRAAFSRRVKAGRLARYRVDGWGSWRLTPLLRYENYYDFDADTPFRFHLTVPPYSCLSSKWVLGSPLCSHAVKRRSLVLDLDETLIHTEVEPIKDADFTFCLSSNEGTQKMYVRIRPHAKHFLAEVSKHFEVIVFTASERAYAEHVLKNLDPTGCLVEHVLCREDCTYIEGEFIKDLGALKRDLTDVVLIDNRPEMYCYHADNGVPISSWFEDRRDCELLRLMPSLARLTSQTLTDVRSYVRHHWRTFEHVKRIASQMTPNNYVVASSFDSLSSSTDWLSNDSRNDAADDEDQGSYYNDGDQKNSLFSIGTCSRSLNNHFFFKDSE
jgi:CTD small phosphatase-like protein 2